jgi:hypothetical protein
LPPARTHISATVSHHPGVDLLDGRAVTNSAHARTDIIAVTSMLTFMVAASGSMQSSRRVELSSWVEVDVEAKGEIESVLRSFEW